ncbi:MAG: hypothetical protein RLZZ385_1383 [Pseudomonadota bacterium]|jgi:myo-inositol-1(or 4)-monophosphatase
MHPLINLALRAARDAAEVLAQQVDRLDRVSVLEDSPGCLLTSTDKDAERSILYHLQKAYPDHSYHTRVAGLIQGKDPQVVWYIDPVAGNRNFMRGLPGFLVSIAAQVDGKLAHAVLIDPLQDEEFTASRGAGAMMNSRRLRVTTRDKLEGAVVALEPAVDPAHLQEFAALQSRVAEVGASWRTSGSVTLDLLYSAAGRLDGGCSPNPGRLPVLAAALVLQEAGGLLSDSTGSPDFHSGDRLVFGNPKCFKHLLKMHTR